MHSPRIIGFLLVLLLLGSWTHSEPFILSAGAQSIHSDDGGEYVEDEVVVGFTDPISDEKLNPINAKITGGISEIGAVVISVPPGTVDDAIAYLETQPNVRYAEPNYFVYADDTYPSDTSFSLQYGLTNIHAPQGWDWSTGAGWVTIAIVDSGVDYLHPDLAGKVLAGIDLVNGDSDAMDDNGHGTHVAGIAAAATNNGEGISGVSWGAGILPVKVLNASGNGTYVNVANGIIWATDHGAQVINLSLGGASPSIVLEDAVNYAYTRGVVQVGSTGNSGGSLVLYPAHYAPVIAVAATDASNIRAAFSNFGNQVDLSAPGDQIYSLYPGGGYGYRSGTSMAAPYVSGLAAILIGLPGNYNAGWVENQMETTALDLGAPGWDPYYGFGLIQMDPAIQVAYPTPTFTPTITETPTYTLIPTYTYTSAPSFTDTPTIVNTRAITTTPTSLSFPIFPNPDRTVTQTSTKLIPQTTTLTPVPQGTETISISLSPSFTGTASENEIMAAETPSSNSFFPFQNPGYLCAGSLCLVAGILLLLLLWASNRKSKHHQLR
jgi:thermitase